jgi:hypothetical protein
LEGPVVPLFVEIVVLLFRLKCRGKSFACIVEYGVQQSDYEIALALGGEA